MAGSRDRDILRGLAGQVRQIAELPEMAERKKLWHAHHALRPQRPMVLCFPEGAWRELLPDDQLQCEDKTLHGWERDLRMKVYWWEHLRDDWVIEPHFDVNSEIRMGDYGFVTEYTRGDHGGSYVWNVSMKDLEKDLPKLHFRDLQYDRKATEQNLQRARDLFGDLLPPRQFTWLLWSVGMTWEAAKLIGLEEMMLYMYDQPDNLHALMRFLRDEHMHFIQWHEDQGLITSMNRNEYTGSGGVAYTDELPQKDWKAGNKLRLIDRWGFAESQETVGVSPEMFSQFVLPYQLPLLERFGLNCYGCCEPLDHRIDLILKHVPRLRKVAVAPMANQELMAEKLAGRYVFSRKPNPVLVSVEYDENLVRKDLRRTLEIAGDQPLEIIMKDTHTVQNEPHRLTRWVQIAREEIDRYLSRRTVSTQA